MPSRWPPRRGVPGARAGGVGEAERRARPRAKRRRAAEISLREGSVRHRVLAVRDSLDAAGPSIILCVAIRLGPRAAHLLPRSASGASGEAASANVRRSHKFRSMHKGAADERLSSSRNATRPTAPCSRSRTTARHEDQQVHPQALHRRAATAVPELCLAVSSPASVRALLPQSPSTTSAPCAACRQPDITGYWQVVRVPATPVRGDGRPGPQVHREGRFWSGYQVVAKTVAAMFSGKSMLDGRRIQHVYIVGLQKAFQRASAVSRRSWAH